MPTYEVVIPPAGPEQPFELRLRADADSWLPALKLGVEKICGGELAPSVLCQVQRDGSVVAADPSTGRAFQMVELSATPASAPAAPAPAAPAARRPAARSPAEREREDLLADLFLHGPRALGRATAAEGLGALLDLALEKVRCAGARAFLAGSDGVLSVAAARGQASAGATAHPVRISMGAGVVGFSARHAVGLAVSDLGRDRRWQRAAGPGEPARSVLCAPMVRGARIFGVLELFDRADGPFDAADQAVLEYLSHHGSELLATLEGREPR